MKPLLTNVIRLGAFGAGLDRHATLNDSASAVSSFPDPDLYYPFPDAKSPNGPHFAASQSPAAWLNVSHWRFQAQFNALGRGLSMDAIAPAGNHDYDPDSGEWSGEDPVSRFDLLALADSFLLSAVLVDQWNENDNERRQITASLALELGRPKYSDNRWWIGLGISGIAQTDIDTSGTGQFLDEDVETTITGLRSHPDGETREIFFLGNPMKMNPVGSGYGSVSLTASISASAYYEDWFFSEN